MGNSRKVLILGLGGVGRHLTSALVDEGHSVTVIEPNPETIQRAEGDIDARMILGDGLSHACWREAAASGMDFLIAVTNDDAVNILSAMIADRFGIPTKIARVRSRGLWVKGGAFTPEDFKIDFVIQPKELAAQEVARLLKMRSGNSVFDLADGAMQVIGTRIGASSDLLDLKIKDISRIMEGFPYRVVAIARDMKTLIPGGDDEIRVNDYAYFLVRAEDVPDLMLVVGMGSKRRPRLMVIGGGDVGSRIAELLENSFNLKLIEADERRAEALSQQLKNTEILHGDGADPDTLLTAGLLSMDTVITATGDNESNIMTSALAKHLIRDQQPGERRGREARTITLVKREEYLTLATTMGSDIVLSRKVLAGDRILAYILRGKMLSVARLYGVDAEVVELVAAPRSLITRTALADVPGAEAFHGKLIIGGVFQRGEWRTATGHTRIAPGDRLIAVCRPKTLPDVERLVLG